MAAYEDQTKLSARINSSQPDSNSLHSGATAVSLGVQTSPGNFRRKRATDLIVPPEDGRHLEELLLPKEERLELLEHCVKEQMTGCYRISNDRTELRGALLLFRGRIFGAIYTSKLMPEAQPSEPSLRLFLSELGSQATKVQLYELPEDRVLCQSALFVGQPVPRSDELSPLQYFDYIVSLLMKQDAIGCVAVNMAEKTATYLAFVHRGSYLGSFHVDEPLFEKDMGLVRNALTTGTKASIHACVLSTEKLQKGELGFRL
jgi:hypothetical protein